MKKNLFKDFIACIKLFFILIRIIGNQEGLVFIMLNVSFYIELSGQLANKPRKNGGNMFRHQMITFAILLQHKQRDIVLLKASLIHDLFEEFRGRIEEFKETILSNDPRDGLEVIKLVEEVTIKEKKEDEKKEDFYISIFTERSKSSQILKLADNISNITHLAHRGNEEFSHRYIKMVESITLKFSEKIDKNMHHELVDLISLKKEGIKDWQGNK